jgi:hypothetical protein
VHDHDGKAGGAARWKFAYCAQRRFALSCR